MTEALPSERELAELRGQLLASASRSLPRPDAEDVTQEALLRLVRDRRPSSVPLRRRAYRKLKDTRAELLRAPKRAFQIAAEPLEGQRELAVEDSALAVIGLEDLLSRIAGPDVLDYVRLKIAKLTDNEIAARLEWSPQRVEAARKKYSRKLLTLARAVEDFAP